MGSGQGKTRRLRTQGFAIGSAFEQKYHGAVEYLNDKFAYFLTHILNIGEPSQHGGIPTACVALPKKGSRLEDFQFLFNPDFAEKLDDSDMGFVLAHETMHILLNHLRIAKDFDDQRLFNLAADSVINDYLDDIGLEVPSLGLVTGEKLVGHNCMNSTVAEVYQELEQKQQQGGGGQGDDDADGKGGVGGYGGGFGDYKQIDDHGWMHDPTPGSAEHADGEKACDQAAKHVESQGDMPKDLEDKKQAEKTGKARGYSLADSFSETQFVEEKGVKLKWLKLLQEIEPDIIKKQGMYNAEHETWSRPHRKTMQHYPSIILPGVRDDEPVKRRKPSIVLALDTSGSIGGATANKFVNLARSIPQERVHLHVCTFTTQYQKLDLEDPRFSSGGTNFSAIENFIRKEVMPENRNKYPQAVVVITDGDAPFSGPAPAKADEASWHWLLTDDPYGYYGHRSPAKTVGKNYKLDDFI